MSISQPDTLSGGSTMQCLMGRLKQRVPQIPKERNTALMRIQNLAN